LPALNPIGQPFIELLTVESTNNYAMGLARAAMAQHGTAVFSHEQTKGKGQRMKEWVSSKRLNLALSVMVAPTQLRGLPQFSVSRMAAIAVQELVSNYVKNDVTIKWPNDIYWRDRKAAGILIENNMRGNSWQWAVAGMGVNINQTTFNSSLTNPVSLKQITGKTYDVAAIAKTLCECLQVRYEQLQQDRASILRDYNAVLYKKGEVVRLKKSNAVFSCIIKEVNAFGQLQIEDAPFTEVEFGEVEWVIR